MALPAVPDIFRLRLVEIAKAAGLLALRDFRRGGMTRAKIDWKHGGSPVTGADLAVDAFLAETLPVLGSEFPALAPLTYHSEEQPKSWREPHRGTAFVVDPIDGTRDFMDGGEAWCIVIGVIRAGVPLAGVVHMPATGRMFSATRGGGAFLDGQKISAPERLITATPTVAGPRSALDHLGARLGLKLGVGPRIPALAHRVLAPIAGIADLAVARGGGHDWDIVASDCILNEAGARLLALDGAPLRYTLAGEDHPPLLSGAVALIDALGLGTGTSPEPLGKPEYLGKKTLLT
jgi:myo-inositol-1(or 4)-monophosphatase